MQLIKDRSCLNEETYETPLVEIVKFENDDIITTSSIDNDFNDEDFGWD
ncbi:MAG: hypothetical protein V8R64_10585 [Thomasclavelia sp.]